MVKQRKKNSRKKRNGKGFHKNRAEARKINASTAYETCTEQLSPFGGLLALIKFLDLVNFKEIFHSGYQAPLREPKLGHHLMMVGILMLLFIGFGPLSISDWMRCCVVFSESLGFRRPARFGGMSIALESTKANRY